MKKSGRPLKGTNYRAQVTIYVDIDLLNKVDKKVQLLKNTGKVDVSRSELYHRSMVQFLEL